jgi:bifunctional oligoribonuclease and PAP phosphatase NrnA
MMPSPLKDEARNRAMDALLHPLREARRVVLVTHMNADGDGVGSQIGMLELIRHFGGEARIVNPTPFPELFRFLLAPLPEGEQVVLDAASPEAEAWCRDADLALVVDTGEVPRIGRVKPLIEHLPHLVVDHHPEGDRPLPGVAWREVEAAATGEMVYALLERALTAPWAPGTAEALYTAILTDTGSFRFSNTTARVHRVVAELIARGADPEGLQQRIYGNVPLRRFRLLEAALPSLAQSPDGRVAWMTIPRKAYEALECDPADVEGMNDYPRTLVGVEIALLFREVDEGVKISFRSNGAADVNALARHFGGGGHVRAAGALVRDRRLDPVLREAVEAAITAAEGV